jgi:tRNA (cmo5U34)-methyltransferase
MKKDTVFAEKKTTIEPFEFNQAVTDVFNDMLHRSVPLYEESVHRQSQLAAHFYRTGSRIYDLGCSNGNLGIRILRQFNGRSFSMKGVDSSPFMIEKYLSRLENRADASGIELICRPMEDVEINNASVVLINLTLQFVDVDKRDDLIKQIYTGLNPGGVMLLTEKTAHSVPVMNDLEKKYYRSFKLENGYSDLEISQKRDALEKVLVPETIQDHERRLRHAGFTLVETWLKWFNFTSFMAIK